ncbi:MAG: hypothetical protein WD226_12530 [Planctomycetota bacterium]
MRSTLLAPLGLFVLAASFAAQSGGADLERFQSEHGFDWRSTGDAASGAPRLLFGGDLPASIRPRVSADYVRIARAHLDAAAELVGAEARDLVLDRELFLPLGLIGSSDKITVRFRQRHAGLEVEDASVNVLLDVNGNLRAIFSKALRIDSDFVSAPAVSQAEAVEFAWTTFQTEGDFPASYVQPAELVVVGAGVRRDATLAWRVAVVVETNGIVTAGFRYTVGADDGGARILTRDPLVHNFDVGGQVFTNATPGLDPDSGSNPAAPEPLAYARVSSPQAGTTTTDANGFFNYPGVTGAIDVTVGYEGAFNDVETINLGPNHTLSAQISGTGNALTLNAPASAAATAQANAFQWINRQGEWIRSVNPADLTANFVADANVNLGPGDSFVDNCNAFYNGVSTNYLLPGGGCVNTAFSTVIAHEMGHWFNVRYGSGNGPDGFGEGNADIFAMYLADDPIVGNDFFSGGFIRTGTNTRQYCGDGLGGCYGGVHANGEVLMGAFWKMRVELQNAYGAGPGGDIADALFLGWMNAFDQSTIDSIIEIQLLVLDDDDGNPSNGTPHQLEIGAGMRQQGFPGPGVQFSNVTVLADTLDENGPYGVSADLEPVFSSGILAATLFYSVDGGPESFGQLSHFGGDTWGATIPGAPSPARIAYRLEATNALGDSRSFPPNGGSLSFAVGVKDVYYEENFDGPDDAGWTHAQVSTQDDWQRGVPQGRSGSSQGVVWSDPASAFSGPNAWGNDLGPSGFNGSYQPNVENYLRSPSIDLSSASNVSLSFRRWLTVEEASYDQAQIRVNGNVVWENPQTGHLLDTAWNLVSLDIASFADGDPAAVLEFRLISDGGLNLGGWNIDDLALASLGASPTACVPTNYGAGLAGTTGSPTIDSLGQPARLGNGDFAVAVKNGLPGATALVGRGLNQANVAIFGGTLLVAPNIVQAVVLDAFGQAVLALPLPNDLGLVGETRYVQAFVLDPAAPAGIAMTPGLTVTICN